MTISELVTNIKLRFPELSEADCLLCLNEMITYMSHHLSQGNKFEIRGFGTFSSKQRAARIVRNPRTGEKIQRSETAYPCFKSGKMLKDRLNKILSNTL